MNEIIDCRGVRIHVGDTIVYPGRRGSSLWLSEGVVQPPVYENQHSLIVARKANGKIVEIFETGRVAVVATVQASA
jgi:hypothetical protein